MNRDMFMKNFALLILTGATLSLAACGGSSDSSSFTGTNTLGNGNVYTCSTEKALDACDDDASCAATDCTLTTKVVEPASADCVKTGNTISIPKGTSCKVAFSGINGGVAQDASCSSGGVLTLGATFTNGSANLNGTTVTCK